LKTSPKIKKPRKALPFFSRRAKSKIKIKQNST